MRSREYPEKRQKKIGKEEARKLGVKRKKKNRGFLERRKK